MNQASIVTTASATAVSTTASVVGVAGVQYQIIGFDGSCNDQAFRVALRVGDKIKALMEGTAGSTVGRGFNDWGPVGGYGSTVSITTTPAASGLCRANLYYRIIL